MTALVSEEAAAVLAYLAGAALVVVWCGFAGGKTFWRTWFGVGVLFSLGGIGLADLAEKEYLGGRWI